MGNMDVLKKILSEENQKLNHNTNNPVWRFRGWNVYPIIEKLFGSFSDDELETFTYCSQYIQYEALRYAILADRKRMFFNCGSIIWQFQEPYPNICCTNIVDYYGFPKLGYYGVKKAFESVTLGLTYKKLIWKANEQFLISPFIVNDLEGFKDILNIQVRAYNGENLLNYKTDIDIHENGAFLCKETSFIIPENIPAFYVDLNIKNVFDSYLFFVENKNGFADKNIAVQEYEKIKKEGEQFEK